MTLKKYLKAEDLASAKSREVKVHVGERHAMMILSVFEVGYTLQNPCDLTIGEHYPYVTVRIANAVFARVGEEFIQVVTDGTGTLHLYLPSPVDDDDRVWKLTEY